MPVKIAVTIIDGGMAFNVGGSVDSRTAVIELTDEQVPRILRQHLDVQREIINSDHRQYRHLYQTVLLSLLDEVK